MYWVFLTKGSFDKTGGFFPDIIISTSQSAKYVWKSSFYSEVAWCRQLTLLKWTFPHAFLWFRNLGTIILKEHFWGTASWDFAMTLNQ